jgi:hypothetical protein
VGHHSSHARSLADRCREKFWTTLYARVVVAVAIAPSNALTASAIANQEPAADDASTHADIQRTSA